MLASIVVMLTLKSADLLGYNLPFHDLAWTWFGLVGTAICFVVGLIGQHVLRRRRRGRGAGGCRVPSKFRLDAEVFIDHFLSLILAGGVSFPPLALRDKYSEAKRRNFRPSQKAWKWADKQLKKMSVEEKVGQLVHIGINAKFLQSGQRRISKNCSAKSSITRSAASSFSELRSTRRRS